VGRDDEFSAYVASRWTRLVRSAVLLGCSPTEAEDVVQTALIRCLIHWSKVERASDRDAYVHRVLINTFTSARRRHWWRETTVATQPDQSIPDDAEAIADTDAVFRSLSRLSTDHRNVVVLRYYAHLTEQQLATALDIPPGTVKSRLARALRILADDSDLAVLRGAR